MNDEKNRGKKVKSAKNEQKEERRKEKQEQKKRKRRRLLREEEAVQEGKAEAHNVANCATSARGK